MLELEVVGSIGFQRMQEIEFNEAFELARHHHALAQKNKGTSDYQEAVRWYRLYLTSFPTAPEAAQTNFLLAELLEAAAREQIIAGVLQLPGGTRFSVLAPIIRAQKGEHRDLFADAGAGGGVAAGDRVAALAPGAGEPDDVGERRGGARVGRRHGASRGATHHED